MKLNRRPVNRVGDLNVPTALWTESPPSPPSCSLTISFICCLSLLTFNLHVVFHVYLKRCFKMKKMMNHLFYFSCFCFFLFFCASVIKCPVFGQWIFLLLMIYPCVVVWVFFFLVKHQSSSKALLPPTAFRFPQRLTDLSSLFYQGSPSFFFLLLRTMM